MNSAGYIVMFPAEILRQFVRDRKTLAAFRCTCREFCALTVPDMWAITVEMIIIDSFQSPDTSEFCARYTGETPYAPPPTWCPYTCEQYIVTVIAGATRLRRFDVTSANSDKIWIDFARYVAREFLLVERDPLIPYYTCDGEIREILCESVRLESDDPHYCVVVEPAVQSCASVLADHRDKFVPTRGFEDCIIVTLLARASVIAACL